jgi:hypothetical protein
MRLVISDIDCAPEDLLTQAPIAVDLVREMPGADRPDYWLGRLAKPLHWKHDGREDEILYVVIVARWAGTRIGRNWTLPVSIAYVTDSTLLEDASLDFGKCAHVAIGMARRIPGATRFSRVAVAVVVSLIVLAIMQAMGC